jgi:hypothetical protein
MALWHALKIIKKWAKWTLLSKAVSVDSFYLSFTGKPSHATIPCFFLDQLQDRLALIFMLCNIFYGAI